MSFDDLQLDGPLNMDVIIQIKLSSSIGRLRAQCMITKTRNAKPCFLRWCVNCGYFPQNSVLLKHILDSVFAIPRIIKVSVNVISRSRITLTFYLKLHYSRYGKNLIQ